MTVSRLAVHANFLARRDGGVSVVPTDANIAWLEQVHGAAVAVVVRSPLEHCGTSADALVSSVRNARLMIRTADCAPILLVGRSGVEDVINANDAESGDVVGIGVVHAGWRGLLAGVVPAAVGALRALGATKVDAALYPCIGPECYEFGTKDLDAMKVAFGSTVEGIAPGGRASLDLPEAVDLSLFAAGVAPADRRDWECTACHPEKYFSHRARKDTERMALVAWLSMI